MVTKIDLADDGYILEKYYAHKNIGDTEICIEFCIGDYCVGAFINQNLMGEKKRCKNLDEALIAARELEKQYL